MHLHDVGKRHIFLKSGHIHVNIYCNNYLSWNLRIQLPDIQELKSVCCEVVVQNKDNQLENIQKVS